MAEAEKEEMGKKLLALMLLVAMSQSLAAEDLYNYAHTWNSWPDSTRDVYLWGLKDGYFLAYLAAGEGWLSIDELMRKPPSVRVKAVADKIFLEFRPETIREVVTDLYRDPANQFLSFTTVVYLARDKLKGETIEPRLQAERKKAFEENRILENLQE